MVRHFIMQRHHEEPREWDPLKPGPDLARDCLYLGKVLAEMAERLDEAEEIHCYLTWQANTLPEYGPHVVAVLVGEECGLIPRYSRHVRMVARIMGHYPFLGVRKWWPPSPLTLVLVAKYLRNLLLHAANRWRYQHPPASWPHRVREEALIVTIPWGSASLIDIPMKAISERTDNYVFSGQIGRGGLPKRLSRGSLVTAVRNLEQKYPFLSGKGTVKVHTQTTELLTDNEVYASSLMNAKVCLAPRGSVADTWRYFEGMKSGCIVLTNPLPREWYYRNAPVLQLDSWNDLEGVLLPLLADKTKMEALHQETLRYWDQVCGEKAVGRYLASVLLQHEIQGH